jgi:hypothetical protein
MSRWSDAEERVARARILARYHDDVSVLEALRRDHRREGWT